MLSLPLDPAITPSVVSNGPGQSGVSSGPGQSVVTNGPGQSGPTSIPGQSGGTTPNGAEAVISCGIKNIMLSLVVCAVLKTVWHKTACMDENFLAIDLSFLFFSSSSDIEQKTYNWIYNRKRLISLIPANSLIICHALAPHFLHQRLTSTSHCG